MQFAQMLQLKQTGVPISDIDLLEAATIQNKNKIIENTIKQQEAASQVQQAQAQAAAELQAAQVRLADSQSQANLQLGAERQSRIQENFAQAQERVAEASKDEQQGLLNFVKALKELDNIDLMQLERLLSLQKLLKDTESSNIIKTSEDRGANLAQESNFLGVQ